MIIKRPPSLMTTICAIPIQVLEELDNFKKGNDTRNFAARQFIRLMDELGNRENLLNGWVPFLEKRKEILPWF